MSDKMFTSAVNLTDKAGSMIFTGVPFLKAALVEDTFDALVAQNLIVEQGMPATEIVTPGGKRVTGPDSSTPIAAIYPPEGDKEKLQRLEDLREKLRAANVPFVYNTGIVKLQAKLAEYEARIAELEENATATAPAMPAAPAAKAAANPKDNVVAKVWDFDPAELEKLPQEQVAAKYVEQCKKFKQEIVSYDDPKLMIAHMSSEFVK